MGLFDNIKCEYNVPKPEPLMELVLIDLSKTTYQTQDFECLLDDYVLDKEGKLFKIEYDIVDRSDSKAEGWKRIIGMFSRENPRLKTFNYTGEIEMYNSFDSPFNNMDFETFKKTRESHPDLPPNFLYDYWIMYRVKFIDGELKNINITEYSYVDNSKRLCKLKSEENAIIFGRDEKYE